MLGAVHIYAGYLFSRNATLAILLVASMIFRSKGTLNTLILLTAFIQLLDAAVDCMEGRWVIETRHNRWEWEVIVEPLRPERRLLVITAYPLDETRKAP